MLSILSCVCWQSVYLLWRNVYLDLLPIFWVVWFFDIELHELLVYFGNYPLSVASFTNTFSQSIGFLFILFVVSSVVQKLLSLVRSHLFIFAFISFALGDGSKKTLLRFMSENVLHMFSCSFMVSYFIFRPLNHFEFIFVCGVSECSNFMDLHEAVQLSQQPLLKRLSFLHCIFLPPFSKTN